jgi:hypothetical protein
VLELHSNFNNIRVRSFTLNGAPFATTQDKVANGASVPVHNERLGLTGNVSTSIQSDRKCASIMMLASVLTQHGLLYLGADEVGTALPPVLAYWREFGVRYVTALCALPDIAEGAPKPPVPVPAEGELDKIAAAVPPMTGAEYLTAIVLADLWRGTEAAFDAELADAKLSVQAFLKGRHPAWIVLLRRD